MSMFDSGLPSITVLCDVPFPATLISGPGIQVLTADPTAWEMSLDYDPLPEDDLTLTPLSNYYLAVEDTTETPPLYSKVRLDHFGNQVLNIDQRTPIGDQSYNVATSDRYVGLTAQLSNNRIITLPPAATVAPGRQLTLQDEVGGLNGTTACWVIMPSGADLIDGKNVLYMSRRYAGYRLTCDGVGNWSTAAPSGMIVVSAVPSYAVSPDDDTVAVGVISGSSVTVTLPPCTLCFPGKSITVLDLAGQCSPTSTIVVQPQPGELINGVPAALQATLNSNYSYITLQTDGSGRWTVTAGGTNPATDTIVSTQISDSTGTGRNVLTAASQTIAQQAIGATALGTSLFTAASPAIAQEAIGASAFGQSMFTTANAGTAQALLALGNMATQNNSNVNITGGTVASTQLNNCPIVGGTIDNTVIGATSPASAAFSSVTTVNATVTGNLTISGSAHAPTPAPNDNSTSIATTAYVMNAMVTEGVPAPSNTNPLMSGTAAPGTSGAYSRGDHVHPSDSSKFNVAGGSLTGDLAVGGNFYIGSNFSIVNSTGHLQCNGGAQFYNAAGWNNGNGVEIYYGFLRNSVAVGMLASTSTSFGANPSYVWGVGMWGSSGAGGGAMYCRVDTTAFGFAGWLWGTSSLLGQVTTNGSVVIYGGTSDGRLKENIRDLTDDVDVGAMIDGIRPVAFEWLDGRRAVIGEPGGVLECPTIGEAPRAKLGKHQHASKGTPTGHGFVAQDLIKIAPHAVHAPDDGVRKLGNFEDCDKGACTPWMIDPAKLVPYLVAELQLLRKRVAALEG